MDSHGEEPTQLYDPALLRARGRVGSILRDKWQLDAFLGSGGMGAVYAATHTRNGSRAALKILHAELSANPLIRRRFLLEGRAANMVAHDGVARVLDDDVAEDGSVFLVSELLDGETVEDRRVRLGGRLSEDETLSIADQLLDVLAAAHAKGIIHRDLKPENLFLCRDGCVKVLDFGVARLIELSTTSTSTKPGNPMGTPAYMAPEQARALWDEVDARSDVWAVGATMFTLLSGRLVHEGRSSSETLVHAATNPAPALYTVLPRGSLAVAHVVDTALAFDKGKRWGNAKRMQDAVRRAYQDKNKAPITTASKLQVPADVKSRALALAEKAGPGFLTTARPVAASGLDWVRSQIARTPPRLRLGGAVAALVASIATLAAVSGGNHSKTDSSAATSPASRAGTPAMNQEWAKAAEAPMLNAVEAATGSPATAAPPLIAATDLPTAAPATSILPPPKTSAAARSAASSTPLPRPADSGTRRSRPAASDH